MGDATGRQAHEAPPRRKSTTPSLVDPLKAQAMTQTGLFKSAEVIAGTVGLRGQCSCSTLDRFTTSRQVERGNLPEIMKEAASP